MSWLSKLFRRKPEPQLRILWTAFRAETAFWEFVEQTGPIPPASRVFPPPHGFFERAARTFNESGTWTVAQMFKDELWRQARGYNLAPDVIENVPPQE